MKLPASLNLIIFGFVSLVSMPFLGVGIYEGIVQYKAVNYFEQIEGTVVGNRIVNTQDEGVLTSAFFPEVEFIASGGSKIRFTDKIGSFPEDYKIGEKVVVLHSSDRFEEAQIYSLKRIWLAVIIFIFIGMLPPAITLLILRKINRSALSWFR